MVLPATSTGLLQGLGEGIFFDTPLVIPTNCFAVIAKGGQPLYTLPGGSHAIHPAQFPLLKVNRGHGAISRDTLDAACYVVRADPVTFVWNVRTLIDSKERSLTSFGLSGRLTVRVVDPLRFFQTTYQQLFEEGKTSAENKSFRLAQPGKEARHFAIENLTIAGDHICSIIAENAVQQVLLRMNLTPEQIPAANNEIQTAAGKMVAQQLIARGLALEVFYLDTIQEPKPMECQTCGSLTAPTASAIFRYNVSLFVVRFSTVRGGAYCPSCALKYGLGYTALTLVGGWWGLIGLVLSPIFIIQNLFNIIRVLVRARLPRAA